MERAQETRCYERARKGDEMLGKGARRGDGEQEGLEEGRAADRGERVQWREKHRITAP